MIIINKTSTNKRKNIDEKTINCAKRILEYRKICEANIVSSLWKNIELYYEYDNLNLNDFSNNAWKVYFTIGYEIIVKEHKKSLDEITVNLYLEKHPKLKAKFKEYGGIEQINRAKEYVNISNVDGYIKEMNRWKVVTQMLRNGFPVENRLKDFVDMSTEEIYEEYEAVLAHTFINIEDDEQVHDMSDGLHELIDEMDECLMVGLPFKGLDILTAQTGGCLLGNITMCLGNTGSGKSTFARNVLVSSVIDNDEKIMFFLNEENEKKFKSEIMVYVVNNILLKNSNNTLKKYVVRKGRYSEEVKTLLKQAADWMIEHKDKVKIVPFKRYKTSKVVKYIKKYSAFGYKYFCLDTYKIGADDNSIRSDHEVLERGMVELYDTVKESNKNVHLWVSAQLVKTSDRQRFLSIGDIGKSKNMADTPSNVLMIRNVIDDEKEGEKKEIKAYKITDKGSKIPIKLKKDEKYQIIFIPKGRFKDGDYQIILQHNLSTNEYKELGICFIPPDF